MKRRILIAIMLISVLCSLCACKKDGEQSEELIPVSFLANVKLGDKWGYINTEGEMVIQPQYDYAADFDHDTGLAYVERDVGSGKQAVMIDKSGNVVVEQGYMSFRQTFAKNGLLLAEYYENANYTDPCKYGYVDRTGRWVIQPKYNNADSFNDSGLAAARIDKKWGFINETGDFVVQPQYDIIYSFKECGFAEVVVDGKWGTIDQTGNLVIQPKYTWGKSIFDDRSYLADNGDAIVVLDGKWGIIDKTGKIIIPVQYDRIEPFADNGLAVAAIDGKWGYLDRNNQWVIQPQYDNGTSFNGSGFAGIMSGDKWGLIDQTGKVVVQPQYDQVYSYKGKCVVRVLLDNKWGLIDQTGKLIVQPQYDEIRYFDVNNLAKISSNGKWGLIDQTGKIVTQLQYDEIEDSDSNGYARVSINGKWGLVDKTGKLIVPTQYDEIGYFDDDNLTEISSNGKWGLVDKTGKVVVQPQYDEIGFFGDNGTVAVSVGGKWGAINEKGEQVIQPRFDKFGQFRVVEWATAEELKNRQESQSAETAAPVETTEAAPVITGVPESVVLREIELEEGDTYTLTHHYDAPSHIDDVTVTVTSKKKYGEETTTYTYAYQYDRSSDLWSQLRADCEESSAFQLNEDAFIGKTFEGRFKRYHTGSYVIRVKDVDFTAGTVRADYTILFDDGEPPLFGDKTFQLQVGQDEKTFCFFIPYTRSIVVMFDQVFIFDMEKGLHA